MSYEKDLHELTMLERAERIEQLEARLTRMEDRDRRGKEELEALLQQIPDAIRVREGGGKENLYASLAVSVAKLTGRLTQLERELAAWRRLQDRRAESNPKELSAREHERAVTLTPTFPSEPE